MELSKIVDETLSYHADLNLKMADEKAAATALRQEICRQYREVIDKLIIPALEEAEKQLAMKKIGFSSRVVDASPPSVAARLDFEGDIHALTFHPQACPDFFEIKAQYDFEPIASVKTKFQPTEERLTDVIETFVRNAIGWSLRRKAKRENDK